MTVRVGLAGAGATSAAHLRTLSQDVTGVQIAAIADTDLPRGSALAENLDLSGLQIVDDPHRLVSLPQGDSALTASPDDTHPDLVMACLDAVTPVLREKPLVTIAEACVAAATSGQAIDLTPTEPPSLYARPSAAPRTSHY